MKRLMAGILAAVMTLMGLTGCSKHEPQPQVPQTPELPGTLVGVDYATGSGMTAHSEFSIRVTPMEIERTAFWPENTYADEICEGAHIPITENQWDHVETVILDLYRDGELEAYTPMPEAASEDAPQDLMVLDGGDYTALSLIWETKDGTAEISYRWPGDRRVITLVDLLRELADPQGREILWYESPQLNEIYFTRKHRVNTDRDFSFQLHWTEYEDEDPHWELIYYLGKHGAVANGRIRLEEADWDRFVALAEQLQLEYFPEQTRSEEHFKCRLYKTDGRSKNVALNAETEELLKHFFMELVQQHQ